MKKREKQRKNELVKVKLKIAKKVLTYFKGYGKLSEH